MPTRVQAAMDTVVAAKCLSPDGKPVEPAVAADLRTALNVIRDLEQTLTPFRGPNGCSNLLQTRSPDRPIWTPSRSIQDR